MSLIKKFFRDNKAIAAVEFALSVPILLLLFMGTFEVARYVLIVQKASKSASAVSDLIARSPSISETDINNLFVGVQHMMTPYFNAARIRVFVTDISYDGTIYRCNWQRNSGTLTATSAVAPNCGATMHLPAGFTMFTNEDVIVAEIYYRFAPVVAPRILGARTIYKAKYSKPRLGGLLTVKP